MLEPFFSKVLTGDKILFEMFGRLQGSFSKVSTVLNREATRMVFESMQNRGSNLN